MFDPNALPCAPLIPLSPAEAEALAFLMPLSNDYPGIETWYLRKVVPGLRLGTRTLIRMERDGQLVALGIGKRDAEENKICTVRVSPTHVGRGLGVRLFEKLLRWIDDDRPHLTVSDQKYGQYQRIFEHFGFDLASLHAGLYTPTATELAFNEIWRAPEASSHLQSHYSVSSKIASSSSKLAPTSRTTSGILSC